MRVEPRGRPLEFAAVLGQALREEFDDIARDLEGRILLALLLEPALEDLQAQVVIGRHEFGNEAALKSGVQLTVDNAWAVQNWPGLFAGKSLFLRLDLEAGYGHHKKVVTAGADSKFGISLQDIDAVMGTLHAQGATVTGLHTHTGSGVTDVDVWREQLERFVSVLPKFPDARVLDLGGGEEVEHAF